MPPFVNKITVGLAVLALAVLAFFVVQANPDLLKKLGVFIVQDTSGEVILVSDQKVIDDSIIIGQATIKNPQGGFIIIFKIRTDGSIEATLGSTQYLAPGTYEDLKVPFYSKENRNNATVASGDTLEANFVIDDGDKLYNEPDQRSTVSDVFKVL